MRLFNLFCLSERSDPFVETIRGGSISQDMNMTKFVRALLRCSPKRISTMLNGANTMRSLLTLGLLMTLCASASAASGLRTHTTRHSINYGRYHSSYGRYYGYSQYYGGGPNNRGGLVGGDDSGT